MKRVGSGSMVHRLKSSELELLNVAIKRFAKLRFPKFQTVGYEAFEVADDTSRLLAESYVPSACS